MQNAEDKLARELGFRVTEKGFIDTHFRGENRNLALWRKCLELTEQRGDETLEDCLTLIVRDVAELPDRSSPEDWPEAMLVTDKELREIVRERIEAYASSRLVEVSAQLQAERKEYEKEIDRLQSVCVLAEKERDALAKPVDGISDSNYETGQTLWREWFEGGGRKPPEIQVDTSLMLTWIVAKFRAKLARLTGERDALGAKVENFENSLERGYLCGMIAQNGVKPFVGGCGKPVGFWDAYRCADCTALFHRDCIWKHFELDDAVNNIRAKECWRKDCSEMRSENATLRAELAHARGLLEESWTTLCDVCEFHGDPEYHLDVEATRELMKRIDAAKRTEI